MPIPITTTSAGMVSNPQSDTLHHAIAIERGDCSRKPDVDAASAMSASVVVGYLGSGHPPENPVRGFDDAYLQPETFRGRGDFQTDVPSTHDDQSPPATSAFLIASVSSSDRR